jgi:cell wall-associated NlpC family hydrolase
MVDSPELVVKLSISKFIGIPFVNGGRDYSGCDCWGLVKLIYKELANIDLPEYHISCHDTAKISTAVNMSRRDWVKLAAPEVPCLVVMYLDRENPIMPSHVGVYVGNGEFIHTIEKQNSRIEKTSHLFYKNIIEGYYAYRLRDTK